MTLISSINIFAFYQILQLATNRNENPFRVLRIICKSPIFFQQCARHFSYKICKCATTHTKNYEKKIGRYPPPCIAVSNFEKEILTKNVQICSYISITLYYYHYILLFMQTINKNMKIFFSFGIKHEPNEIKSSHNIQKKINILN